MRRMKSTLSWAIVGVLLLALFVPQAVAAPGPDEDPGPFTLIIQEEAGIHAGAEIFYEFPFDARSGDGWDWGGRSGYHCGFFELVVGEQIVVNVIVEKYGQGGDGDGDGLYAYINSIFGGGGREDCSFIGTAPGNVLPSEGEDRRHPGSRIAVVYRGTTYSLPDLPLQSPYHDDAWWYAGNERGEAILWYGEDSTGEVGIVARLAVVPVVGGVEIVHDAFGPVARYPSSVTLRLRAHLRASGDVTVADGPPRCIRNREVNIQRRRAGNWKRVGSDQTDAQGHFTVRVRNRPGTYRARVVAANLVNGDICEAGVSPTRVHEVG